MTFGIVSILGAFIALIGIGVSSGYLVGIGGLLFLIGFIITTGTLITIPWYVWAFLILLFIVLRRKK